MWGPWSVKIAAGVAESLSGDGVVAPLEDEGAVVGRAEAAPKAVVQGVEVPAEVAAGAAHGFTDHRPEIPEAVDTGAVEYMGGGHGPSVGAGGCQWGR